MEDNTFFKSVWRFNGLVIALAGILSVGVLIFITYKLFNDVTRERNTSNIVNLEEDTEIKESWNLGQLSKLNDGKTLIIPLHSNQSFNRSYFSKSSNSTRNYLFIDTETLQEKWLFDHTDYLIERSDWLKRDDYNAEDPVIAILYQLVKLDSDSDNRLSADDLSIIAIASPDGSNYKELINEVELIVDHTLLSKKELFLIYQKDNISYSAIIDLAKRTIIKTTQLPKIGA